MYTTNKTKEAKLLSRDSLTKTDKEVLLTVWKNQMKHAGQKLTNLTIRNRNTAKINYKLHYLFCDPFTFNNAYSKISKNKGAHFVEHPVISNAFYYLSKHKTMFMELNSSPFLNTKQYTLSFQIGFNLSPTEFKPLLPGGSLEKKVDVVQKALKCCVEPFLFLKMDLHRSGKVTHFLFNDQPGFHKERNL